MDESSSSTSGSYKEAVRTLRHDARNLLNGVSIMADHFEGTDDPKTARFVSYLTEKVETMVRLGERAEAFASMQAGALEQTKITTLLGDLLMGIGPDQKRPQLKLSAQEVTCDPALTRVALAELIDNAMRTGTDVEITSEEAQAGDILITVRDHGPGIAEPAQPNLFTPYKGAKRAGGTSLGLPLAKKAMELQGGSLELAGGEEGTEAVCRFSASR
jgi:signal transduction histidine kinase